MSAASPLPVPLLARPEGGALHAIPDALRAAASLERSWGELRVLRLSRPPPEVPTTVLPEHLVVLNLGADADCEARLDEGPWLAHRVPHHAFAVFPAGLRHAARRVPSEPLLVEIGATFAGEILQAWGAGAALHPLLAAEDPVAVHILLALAEEARAARPGDDARAEALGAALLTRLVTCEAPRAPEPASGLPSAKLQRVLDHVAAHLDAPPSLRGLAELAGLDLYRFVRAFKQSTGQSPHRYVLEARIVHARELLANRALSITEIALRTGFATPSHFSVTFRRMTGTTPRAFRDALPR